MLCDLDCERLSYLFRAECLRFVIANWLAGVAFHVVG